MIRYKNKQGAVFGLLHALLYNLVLVPTRRETTPVYEARVQKIDLSFRQRLSWCAHLFKACVKQHHRELLPALSGLIDRDSVVLDVGSHAGQFTKLFAKIAHRGQVFSIEPGSYALSILRPAISFNRLTNVTILAVGVGEESDRLTLSTPIKESGSVGFGLSHFGEVNDGRRRVEQSVELTTIDRIVEQYQIERLDFIKADIEGWELRMLHGALATLNRFKPSLMLEVVDRFLARADDTAKELFDYLGQLGYKPYVLAGNLNRFEPVGASKEGNIFFMSPIHFQTVQPSS